MSARLPLGATCGGCRHWKRCSALIHTLQPDATRCDFDPSRYSVSERMDVCPVCEGSRMERCDLCRGSGDLHGGAVTCHCCQGEGSIPCVDCEGTGGPVHVEVLPDGTHGHIAPARG